MNQPRTTCHSTKDGTETCTWGLLSVIDTVICCVVIFPLCVFHWRGCWDLLDAYIYPRDEVASSWLTLLLGSLLTLAAYILQPFLSHWLKDCRSCAVYFTLTRLFLYAFGWASLCYWRGVWNLMDHYFGVGLQSAIYWMIGSEGLLLVFKSTRSLVGAPFAIQLDTQLDLMEPDVMHLPCVDQKSRDEFPGWLKYISAVGFSQYLLMTANISVWRCIWNILDNTLLPHHHFLSDVYSLIAGYAMTICIFMCQIPTAAISDLLGQKSAKFKLIFEDVVFFIATWAVLLLWRGGWDLLEAYFLPDKVVGGWTSHWIGTIGLIAIQGFRNVGANGLDLDGGYHGGEGIYPTNYLREFFKNRFKQTSEADEPLLSEEMIQQADMEDAEAPYYKLSETALNNLPSSSI